MCEFCGIQSSGITLSKISTAVIGAWEQTMCSYDFTHHDIRDSADLNKVLSV